tara:strand:- start:1391 stop:1660 length:270 start_codon:yes stop_codon:yes gene_type:complete
MEEDKEKKEKKEKMKIFKEKILGRLKKDIALYEHEIEGYELRIQNMLLEDHDKYELKKLNEFLEETKNVLKASKKKLKLHEDEYLVIMD